MYRQDLYLASYVRLPVGMATLANQLATDSTHCKIVNVAFFTILTDPYDIEYNEKTASS